MSDRRSTAGRSRLVTATVLVGLAAAACGSGQRAASGSGATIVQTSPQASEALPTLDVEPVTPVGDRLDLPVEVEQIASSPNAVTISALDLVRDRRSLDGLPLPAIDPDEIQSGGVPPDGIPSIDEPRFLKPEDVEFLADNEPVLALNIDGDARAYPVQILTWHEIVNDTVAGVPVAVTYCPLCNSAVAYDRRVDGQVVDFGTSGMLWNSSLVMYDRQTETLWSHFTGEAIIGSLTGLQLTTYPVSTVSWSVWRDANPTGLVLDLDTGFDRAYGRNPYLGYDDLGSDPFLFQGEVDGRFSAMTRIVGVELDGLRGRGPAR